MTSIELAVLFAPTVIVLVVELWCSTRLQRTFARAIAHFRLDYDAHLPGVTLERYRRLLESSRAVVVAWYGHELVLRPVRQTVRVGRATVHATTPVLVRARVTETPNGLDCDVCWAPIPLLSGIVAVANVLALMVVMEQLLLVWLAVATVIAVASVVRVVAARAAARKVWVALESDVLDQLRVTAMPDAVPGAP